MKNVSHAYIYMYLEPVTFIDFKSVTSVVDSRSSSSFSHTEKLVAVNLTCTYRLEVEVDAIAMHLL